MKTSFALAFLACVPLAMAQEPPIIHAEVKEVLLDIAVSGRSGAVAASDLTAKDFSVWEDGKPQKITSVSSVAGDPEASQKHFVIYFDFSGMQADDRVTSEKAAAGFIDAMGSPDRYMAVMAIGPSGPRVVQNFTTAKAALKKAVEVPISERAQLNGVNGVVVPLTAVCDSLTRAPGRKALLYFIGGSAPNPESFKPVLTACNRADVAIYVIAGTVAVGIANSQSNRAPMNPGRGLIVNQDFAPQPAAALAQYLADGTGGQSFTLAENLPDRLAAIAREQDDYYRVAYVPPPAKEGSCHTVRIAMNPHGLTARARNEYCTEKQVDLVAGKIAGQALESRAASAAAGTLTVTAQLPYFYTGTNRASARLSLDVIPAGMKFEKDKRGLHGQFDLVASVLRPDGATAARFADTVDIEQENQQSADAFTRKPWHYEHQFTVAPGNYVVQVAIGAGTNAVGKLERPLKVDPWNSATMGLGGIAFSTEISPAAASPESEGPVLEGSGPLVAGGKKFVPAATNEFDRSTPLYFYTEIYDPGLSNATITGSSGSPALMMQYRVLDSKTGEVRADSGMAGIASYLRPGDSVVPFATRLPVARLPAGQYRLELRAAIPASRQTVTRTIEFRLN